MSYFELMGLGEGAWGRSMLMAAVVTLSVAACGYLLGIVFGCLGAAAKLSRLKTLNWMASTYTTVFRGVPDLLIVYLFYFGSSGVLTAIGKWFGATGFIGAPAFLIGSVAIGVISGAYQTEVLRGAYSALSRGELEAARAVGMSRFLMLRRVIVPQAMRFAIPGLGNVWQLALKESALLSVTGLVELMRQAQIGAGSMRMPFTFFLTAGMLYLVITLLTGWLFRKLEQRAQRGVRKAAWA